MVAWENEIEGYTYYIKLEKKLSDNTVEAYLRDLRQMAAYMESEFSISDPEQVREQHVESFLAYLYDKGVEKTTQARVLSGIKSFFTYLLINDRIDSLPTEFIDTPKIGRKLPDVLSAAEVDAMLDGIDLSLPFGHRNRAIMEMLYGCGLRVTELVTLRIGDLFFEEGYVRVVGKGDKQRLVPVGDEAIRFVTLYLEQRPTMRVDPRHAETLFLNNKGRGLTRVMIYHIIRDASARGRREYPSGAADARARVDRHDRDLHPPRWRKPRQERRSASSAVGPVVFRPGLSDHRIRAVRVPIEPGGPLALHPAAREVAAVSSFSRLWARPSCPARPVRSRALRGFVRA